MFVILRGPHLHFDAGTPFSPHLLFDELDAALFRELAEAEKIRAARNAVHEAVEAAREKRLAKIDSDPGLRAAMAQLDALQPTAVPVEPAIAKARAIAAATPRLGEPLGELEPDADRELVADFH